MNDLLNGLRHMADDHPCCAATIAAAIGQLEQLESELMEQARLNGMGGEREPSMLAQIERFQRENERLCKDKERLDWLLDKGLCWRGCDTEFPDEHWKVAGGTEWLYAKHYENVSGRDRIDAARKKGGAK